ncbi:hypothetical protein KUTeg_006436, partial [Tegillarca granosa]
MSLVTRSDQLAAGLLSLGLKKGDRIGILGPNSLEWILTQYGTSRAGMILVSIVNINPQYKQDELEYALNKVDCKAIIVAEDFKGQSYYEMLFQMIPELARAKPNDLHSHMGTLKFSDIIKAGTSKLRTDILDMQSKLQFDEPINIQFTSGTTGFPKGATLTHHNIVNNSRRLGYHEKETAICIPVPLYHCFGMVLGSLMMVNHGSRCVFPSGSFDARKTLQSVSDEKCTSLYGVPTMFIDMLNHPEFTSFDLTSLYTGIMAGYMDDELDKRVSTVGRAHPHTEAKVITENGDVAPIGVPGELCTRGYTTMLKYWNDSDKTRDVIKEDRWYHTGDIGEMDEEGFVEIVGRIKDMIIRGGENVYPLEIEQLLYKHPKVKDVQVVGVPDKRLGEEICAWLARFKVPRYVEFVEEFPLTVTGKVQKFKIRDKAAHNLGLDQIRH